MSDLKLLQNQALIKKNFDLDTYKKQLSKAQQDLTLVTDPLAIIGAAIQWGLSEIPMVGGFLSFMTGIFWPTNDTDVWETIKDRVKNLVDDEIDTAEWSRLQTELNEVKDKLNAYAEELQKGQYDLALNSFNYLLNDFIGKEDLFKLTGHNFAYSFSPLFSMMINLKITFFVESYRARNDMGLSTNQITAIQNDLASTVNGAKLYLANLERSVINNTGIGDTPKYISFCNYYYLSVLSFNNFLWNANVEYYLNPSDVWGCRIPVCAYGTFPNAETSSGMQYLSKQDILKCCRDGCNSLDDYFDDSGLIHVSPIAPRNDCPIKALTVGITRDNSPVGRCTGIRYTLFTSCQEGGHSETQTINIGKTPSTVWDSTYTVQLTTADFTNDHINKVSIWAANYISRLGFYSKEGNSIEIGQYDYQDPRYDVTIPPPYNLCTIMGPSDVYADHSGSGHELGGVGVGAIYDNDLAKPLLQTAANTMYSQFLTE
ncbi:hypothetical protein COMNV_01039 [Commensalibacter sp. Nvir]|uniref:insecticidal delta-endotoxin Cry8Ea1 family protein n=1 Tax=Commensalibacter sp. Nvir TaxID=3069817 RepID=UPI002D4B0D12|nr:hypothetical protein COMNV_01039 [Commensalibacter sp. Nvir]